MSSENTLNTPEVKEKKKRGRKPKPKPLEPVIKEKKKRGRKPKIKIVNDNEIKKFVLPSKRGRKPKDKTIILNKELNLDKISNCILHLPIPMSKLNSLDEDINTKIKPYDPSLIVNDHNLDNSDNFNKCIYSDIETQVNSNLNDNNINNNDIIDNNDISDNINDMSDNMTDSIENLNSEIKTHYVKMYQGNHNSNVKCNWCLHECENNNIFKLPYTMKNNQIHYYGNFCCPECACAFNFNELNDEYVWERYALLNYLYCDSKDKVSMAPSRLVLDIFGGPLSINEFRSLNSNKQHLNIIMPPQYIVCPKLEVSTSSNDNYGFIPLNINRVNKYTSQLKLQRNSGISNTLDNCMNLKCI